MCGAQSANHACGAAMAGKRASSARTRVASHRPQVDRQLDKSQLAAWLALVPRRETSAMSLHRRDPSFRFSTENSTSEARVERESGDGKVGIVYVSFEL